MSKKVLGKATKSKNVIKNVVTYTRQGCTEFTIFKNFLDCSVISKEYNRTKKSQ